VGGGHVVRMGGTEFWWESLKERDLLEDQGVDGRKESEWILARWAGGAWIGSS
jgi:hypothetical protein